MNKSISILTVLLTISVLALGCGGDEPAAGNNPSTAAPAETTGAVAFEPAYPEEVSTEELSAEDTAQQHQHADGEVHAHDEESTTTRDHGHEH